MIYRYDLFYDEDYDAPRMQQAAEGKYVRYADYETLEMAARKVLSRYAECYQEDVPPSLRPLWKLLKE